MKPVTMAPMTKQMLNTTPIRLVSAGSMPFPMNTFIT